MKKELTSRRPHFILILFFLISTISYSQVGIGTTNPNSNALLDVDSSIYTGGILLPRLGLISTASFAPLSAHVAGMIVYNTATVGDVTPGFYYNNGTLWVRIGGGTATDKWDLTGNAGITPSINFVGTTDNNALRFRTNNYDRFEISTGTTIANGGRLRAFTDGSAASPIYSWQSTTGTGMFQPVTNALGFSTNGTERFRIPNGNQVYGLADGTAALPFYSWSSDPDIGMYRVGTDILGLSTTGTERMRFLANGQVSINNNSPLGTDRFTVTAADTEDAINGYTTTGTGVYGENSSGVGNGVFGNSTNVGARGYGAHGAILESGLDAGYGAIAWNTTLIGTNRTGLLVLGQNLSPITFSNTGALLYGSGSGGASFTSSATGTGFLATGNASTTVYSLTTGSGLAGTGSSTGIYGISTATIGARQGAYFTMNKSGNVTPAAADDPVAILAGYNGSNYFGGYFDGNQDNTNNGGGSNVGEDYAYVGITVGNTTYKILGTGSNSTMINDSQGNKRILFSPEAPEILFEDYGTGQLVNGKSTINLDPLLSSIIHVSKNHPLKVFIQLEGDCNGVYVTDKTANSFTVVELNGGKSNVPFSWHIVANRADTKSQDGTIISKHVDVRFPIGPNKIQPLEINANESKPVNTVTRASESNSKTKIQLQNN